MLHDCDCKCVITMLISPKELKSYKKFGIPQRLYMINVKQFFVARWSAGAQNKFTG